MWRKKCREDFEVRLKRRKLSFRCKTCKTWYSRVWNFLWYEDTVLSFLVNAILIVLIGKFILFPVAGLVMGTDLPAVAVISNSMDHGGQSFDTWWDNNGEGYDNFNITKSNFRKYDNYDGFSKGDVLIVKGYTSYNLGDVIVYHTTARTNPIIHRIVGFNETYQTKGDANNGQILFEKAIDPAQVSGKAILKIPYLGWPKVWLVELLN